MGKVVKIIAVLFLLIAAGCEKESYMQGGNDKILQFDKVIAEITAAVKEGEISVIKDGIYVKSSDKFYFYPLEKISAMTFDEKMEIITNMNLNSEKSYIVFEDLYLLWGDYKNIEGLKNGKNVTEIITVNTIVYNGADKIYSHADGSDVTEIGSGFKGYYFNGINFEGIPIEKIGEEIEFNWENGSPDETIPTDGFSAVWVGELLIPESGDYKFYITGDDGVRLYLNDEIIADGWKDQAPTRYESNKIALVKGEKCKIRMEYYERGGGASVSLGWVKPNGNEAGEIIPKEVVFPGKTYKKPNINIEYEEIMKKVILSGAVSSDDYEIEKVEIDWGDGNSSIIQTGYDSLRIEHEYRVNGEFTVTIKATDTDGNRDKKILTVISSDVVRTYKKIIFLGDSITQMGYENSTGYVRLFEKEYPLRHPELRVEVVGAGIGGNRVSDLQGRVQRDVIDKNPDIVLIYIGINDVWSGGGIEEDFKIGLNDVVDRVTASGAKVILCTQTVIGEEVKEVNSFYEKLDKFSDITRGIALEKGCTLIDLRKSFIDYLKENNINDYSSGVLTTDGVHMNSIGDKLIADTILANFDN